MKRDMRIVCGSGEDKALRQGLTMATRAGRLAGRMRNPIAHGVPFGPTKGIACNVSDGLVLIVGTRENDAGIMLERDVGGVADLRAIIGEIAEIASSPVEDLRPHSYDVKAACSIIGAFADEVGLPWDRITIQPPTPGLQTSVWLETTGETSIPGSAALNRVVDSILRPSVYVKWNGGMPVLCHASIECHNRPLEVDALGAMREFSRIGTPASSLFGEPS